MAKDRKTRRFPLILSMFATVAATAAAGYYRSNALALDEELGRRDSDPDAHTFSVNPGMLQAMKSGATLQITIDSNGVPQYKIVGD